MKIGDFYILSAPKDYKMHLSVRHATCHFGVDVTSDELERLITYLKGVRDGIGWNNAAEKELTEDCT